MCSFEAGHDHVGSRINVNSDPHNKNLTRNPKLFYRLTRVFLHVALIFDCFGFNQIGEFIFYQRLWHALLRSNDGKKILVSSGIRWFKKILREPFSQNVVTFSPIWNICFVQAISFLVVFVKISWNTNTLTV